MKIENVVIVGASNKPDRYSYRAFRKLLAAGHNPIPVHPILNEIEGVAVSHKLKDVLKKVDTVTMYVGPDLSTPMQDDLLALKPRRVIFNPGSENPNLEAHLQKSGVEVVEGCTLVMLSTGEF